jgi:hypothetical protein
MNAGGMNAGGMNAGGMAGAFEGHTLVYPAYHPGGGTYPIDLERFTRSTEMLDMIMQVAGKSWATDKCLAGLVHALDHLLHPQAYLCSGGTDKRLTAGQIRRIVANGSV